MRNAKLLLLLLLLALVLGCGGKPPRSFHEPQGGFSYTPPAGWTPTTIAPWQYHLYCGPEQNGNTPRINVIREEFEGPLSAYMDKGEAGFRQAGIFTTPPGRDSFRTEYGDAGFRWRFAGTENDGLPIRLTEYFFENGSVKVSLFNVTDPRDLSEIGSFVVEGFSYSPAQYDHKAVTYLAEEGRLVIPVTYYGSGYWTGVYQRPSSAMLVLQLDADGVSEVGRIVHENATADRSLRIGDVLYTVSDTTVMASSLSTLELLASLTYGNGQGYYGADGGIVAY
jgi:hypothetical protein